MRKMSIFMLFSFFVLCGVYAAPTPTPTPTQQLKEKVISINLDGPELYKSIVDQVASRLDLEARKRESDRWTLIAIGVPVLVAIVGFFGIRSISDISRRVLSEVMEQIRSGDLIKSLIDEAIKRNITKDIDDKLSSVNDELAFIWLTNIADSISDGSRTGFKPTERDSIVSSLRRLTGDNVIASRPEFAATLEKIIDSFASADLEGQIDSILESHRDVAFETQGIVVTLIQHYGMRLLGDVDLSEATVNNFKDVAGACKRHHLYELVLPFQLVYEYSKKGEGYEENIGGYLKDVETLDDSDKERFFSLIEKYSDHTQIARRPTGQVLRLSEKVNAFLSAYGEALDKLRVA